MIREMSLGDVRKNFGDIINEVRYRHDSVLLQKNGKSIAALVDIELFDKLKSLKAQFSNLTNELAHTYDNVSLNEAEDEIQEALASKED